MYLFFIVSSEISYQLCTLCSAHGRFEGISWNSDETLFAYVAEEPVPSKPTFTSFGYKKGDNADKDLGNWKGQGEWEEDWGETYAGKRQSALFVINISRFHSDVSVSIIS